MRTVITGSPFTLASLKGSAASGTTAATAWVRDGFDDAEQPDTTRSVSPATKAAWIGFFRNQPRTPPT